MYDHKQMMVTRIQYFMKKGYLSNDKTELLRRYEKEVRDKMQVVRNVVIKYNVARKGNVFETVSAMLPVIREAEVELLKQIFDV
jgi:ribosomal protein L19E